MLILNYEDYENQSADVFLKQLEGINEKFESYKKWKEDYQVTQQMLKEHCECDEGRMTIGKKKPSVMKVAVFDKVEDQFTQKKLKEDAPF